MWNFQNDPGEIYVMIRRQSMGWRSIIEKQMTGKTVEVHMLVKKTNMQQTSAQIGGWIDRYPHKSW